MYEEECDSRNGKEENVPETAGLRARYLQRMFCDPRWVLACRL